MISQKKAVLIFQEIETLKKYLYFRKGNFLIFQETELSYAFGNGTFLYFGRGISGTLAYLVLEAYSEPWRI